jgi:signal transduction histidine kinase
MALSEIRSIGQGLALPALAELPPDAVIDLAVEAHKRRTGMVVTREGWLGDVQLGLEHKICLFRLVQEGLNNAVHHSGSKQATVVARRTGGVLEIELANPMSPAIEIAPHNGSKMGIEGLRMRVEVLGGSFSAKAADGLFIVTAIFELEAA